ncbi:MAG: hypothetical protein CMP59_08725 [Flavobacteriales bacterium]|nr:hypothetical protein [Flavobacteriales bacterium]|tara:strand:- start:1121 stop:1933 length:813 start_codon:yes stop_codon:yes gene_type:complete
MRKNYPEIIYKYRDYTNQFHRNLLIRNQLFLASPLSFNDPFDCYIPPNFRLLDTKVKKEEWVNKTAIAGFDLFEKSGMNLEERMNVLDDRLENDIDGFQKEFNENFYQKQSDYLGVISFSERWDSILMWSHYSKSHTGFCLGIFEEKLRSSGEFIVGGKVQYSNEDEYPERSPLDELTLIKSFDLTHHKSSDWSYEKEYRIIKMFHPHIPTPEGRICIIPDSFIAEYIIGVRAPEDCKQHIIQLANEKRKPVYQIEQVPFKFKVSRKLLN